MKMMMKVKNEKRGVWIHVLVSIVNMIQGGELYDKQTTIQLSICLV